MKLTDLSIQRLKPTDKQVVYYDDAIPNFGIRVGKRSKTYIVKIGKTRTIRSLGRYGEITLKMARRAAQEALLFQAPGLRSGSYSDAVSSFLGEIKNHNRPETIRQYKRHLDAFKPSKKLSDIKRTEVKSHLNEYHDRPHAYAHSLAALRVFFNWCIRQEIIESHPIAGERLAPLKSQERVLSIDELRAIYGYSFPPFSTILKLCILTGQRRSEIASIAPEWIEGSTITFPGSITKNKRTHTIPLTAQTKELVEHAPFGKAGAFNGWSNGKRRIDKHIDVKDWTIHDLRRTFSTIHAEIGTPIHVTEKLLNHATGTLTPIAQTYNKYSYIPEMKTALENYEKFVLNL